jgi:hypothetical protein
MKLSGTGIATFDVINLEHCRTFADVQISRLRIAIKIFMLAQNHMSERSCSKGGSGRPSRSWL